MDTVKGSNPAWNWPAQVIYYPCLPNWPRRCQCGPKKDCGRVVK